jgi:ABC-type phosphate/phosphonate transport system substrate-binding protein
VTKWGIDPDIYFKKMMFLGTHPDVFEAVMNRTADAGAVSEEYLYDAKVNNFIVVIDK